MPYGTTTRILSKHRKSVVAVMLSSNQNVQSAPKATSAWLGLLALRIRRALRGTIALLERGMRLNTLVSEAPSILLTAPPMSTTA